MPLTRWRPEGMPRLPVVPGPDYYFPRLLLIEGGLAEALETIVVLEGVPFAFYVDAVGDVLDIGDVVVGDFVHRPELQQNETARDHRVRAVQGQHLQVQVRVLRQLEQPVQLPGHDRPATDSPHQDG